MGRFEVKSTAGNSHLSEGDIDNMLVNYFVEGFETKYNKHLTNQMVRIKDLRRHTTILYIPHTGLKRAQSSKRKGYGFPFSVIRLFPFLQK